MRKRGPHHRKPHQTRITSQALPIAGGVVAGVIGGYLLCRFVVKPLITKFKEKKTSTPTETVTEPVKEEE